MNDDREPVMTTATDTAEGLRRWAKGLYPHEAAVELLIRFSGGRLLAGEWIEPIEDGFVRFDVERVSEAGYLSGGERRVLEIAASLVGSRHEVALTDVLPGLDRAALELVLAAVAHAAGSHEQSRTLWRDDPDAPGGQRPVGFEQLPPAFNWPN